ncbi:hypothetical protein [Flavobacterium cyanobacteriorum]|uniref:hypothetical protein n=1 Tax=Flavobacterium cyanobacteriorum TaxID=2022802 RepID=UPI0013FDA96C|nr:hypothetical protein [Flavobacterium cyanobacteriorum]
MKKSNNPAIVFLFLMPLLHFNNAQQKTATTLVSFVLLLIATGLFLTKVRENKKMAY